MEKHNYKSGEEIITNRNQLDENIIEIYESIAKHLTPDLSAD